jgi:hypothetical protein
MIPVLIVLSCMSVLSYAMLSAALSGARRTNLDGDEYRLESAVESVASLTTQALWGAYIREQGGAPGDIDSFRLYLEAQGIYEAVSEGEDPATAWPPPLGDSDWTDLQDLIDLPSDGAGGALYDNVRVDAVDVARHDVGEGTSLHIVVSASTTRGEGIANPVIDRAIQVVYTIEPAPFEGFDYGVLANNVNCIFCHTVVDTTERFYDLGTGEEEGYERVRLGTLESLMVRDNFFNQPPWAGISDGYADSWIGGTLYVRGIATDHDGAPITDWSGSALGSHFGSFAFDEDGLLIEDLWGDPIPTPFSPAGTPPDSGENLYLDYPVIAEDMPDGALPTSFPPPIPDDGGESGDGAGNRVVDTEEFEDIADSADGTITAGTINVTAAGVSIDTYAEYIAAISTGNQSTLESSVTGNVILTGTLLEPVVIDGKLAIDGDLVINGVLKGEGSLYVSGNIYVPTDLVYADGVTSGGLRTFGVASDGTRNALGLAAGGNILIGDYLRPQAFVGPDQYDIVTGEYPGAGTSNYERREAWNFAIAEAALFNRVEWARTQQFLPAEGEDTDEPETWTAPNPGYDPNHYPRYYQFGEGDEIPIYNKGDLFFDVATGSWHGDDEVPLKWTENKLSIWDPDDTTNPELYDQVTGEPVAAISALEPAQSWLSGPMQKQAIEDFEMSHAYDTPLEIDALLYTNNAIFGIAHKGDTMRGQLLVNGALVCADLGVLAPGRKYSSGYGGPTNVPGSPYKVGLRLNYDRRVRGMIDVESSDRVRLKRVLWNPRASWL